MSKSQQIADDKIKSVLKKYLSNEHNSISGDAFSMLIHELQNIENEWLVGSVVPYLTNVGLLNESNI